MEFRRNILQNYPVLIRLAYLGSARQKRNHGKSVPDRSTFGKRNQSVSQIIAAQSQLPIRFAKRNRTFDIAVRSQNPKSQRLSGTW
jgi:hypothetical protein